MAAAPVTSGSAYYDGDGRTDVATLSSSTSSGGSCGLARITVHMASTGGEELEKFPSRPITMEMGGWILRLIDRLTVSGGSCGPGLMTHLRSVRVGGIGDIPVPSRLRRMLFLNFVDTPNEADNASRG